VLSFEEKSSSGKNIDIKISCFCFIQNHLPFQKKKKNQQIIPQQSAISAILCPKITVFNLIENKVKGDI